MFVQYSDAYIPEAESVYDEDGSLSYPPYAVYRSYDQLDDDKKREADIKYGQCSNECGKHGKKI